MIIICSVCKETFEQNENPDITHLGFVLGRDLNNERCYHCALTYVAGGFAPEGGDFNSAHFISGQMSNQEWHSFQEDQKDLRRRFPEESDEERYGVCQDCGDRTESLETHFCAGCTAWYAELEKEEKKRKRLQLEILLSVRLFRASWWRNCWDMINEDVISKIRYRITVWRFQQKYKIR